SLRARHDDLEVLREGPMLEAVVEDDRSHAELLYGQPRSVVTVRADQHRDARQPPREEKRLVARFLGIEVDRRGVCDDLDPARAAPLAADDDSRSGAVLRQPL